MGNPQKILEGVLYALLQNGGGLTFGLSYECSSHSRVKLQHSNNNNSSVNSLALVGSYWISVGFSQKSPRGHIWAGEPTGGV